MKRLNVAMIGHRFMGKAHSNAWRQVSRFFETPSEPVLKVVCGRDPSGVKRAARGLGWEEASVSWPETGARPDTDDLPLEAYRTAEDQAAYMAALGDSSGATSGDRAR
jgi:predicted dehydrogenase